MSENVQTALWGDAPLARRETITPDLAREYLKQNKVNRRLSDVTVRNYARDMRTGNWCLNGESIVFYEDGTLKDGQHRLTACVKAGVPFETYVIRGIPKASFIHDRGRLRSQVNILDMRGMNSSIANTGIVAAINFLFLESGIGHITDDTVCGFTNDNAELLFNTANITAKGSGSRSIFRKGCFVAATIVARYAGVSDETLSDFWMVANTGFYDGKEKSAGVVLKNFVNNGYNATTTGKKRAFAVATNAIRDFASRNPRTRIYGENIEPAYFAYFKSHVLDKYISSYRAQK